MTHPSSARRLRRAALALLFPTIAAAAILLTGPSVAGAATVEGQASFTLGTGKAGKVLKKQGVRLARVAPARLKSLSGKRSRFDLPARSVVTGPVKVALKGGFILKRGKRSVAARGLSVSAKGKTIKVTARLGGRKLTLLTGRGKASPITGAVTGARITSNGLNLTRDAAGTIKRKLKLRRQVPAAAWGKLVLSAKERATGPVERDPYFTQCGLRAEQEISGTADPAAPLPDMAGGAALSGAPALSWGFKSSFRSVYLKMFGGTLHALDGAGRSGSDAYDGFTFPIKGGSYQANDPVDTTDDQAVVNGKGVSLYCNPKHFFRISISNPTVVIDGASSRLIADVDTNKYGQWTPTQRVDLARLDLSGNTPFFNRSGSEVTWSEVPATLTAAGHDAFCIPTEPTPNCIYPEDTPLDPVSVTVKTAGSEPFPAATFCNFANTTNTMRIDPNWPSRPAAPLATSGITGGTVGAAGLDWGIRQGLRGSQFNVIETTTSTDVIKSNPADMTGAGKYFSWDGSAGTYDPAGAGKADDRLVQSFTGTVGLCNQQHGYGTVISDPTVVIDDDNSRLSADVATRVGDDGDWIRGRVDLVRFKASEATVTETPVSGGTEIKWTLPDGVKDTSGVLLAPSGATMLGPLSPPGPPAQYVTGAAFQGMTVRAVIPG